MRRPALRAGDLVEPRQLLTLRGASVSVPDTSQLVHLQFRRFAGCPVCELHLRAFAQRHDELSDGGVREIVLFHSSEASLRPYQRDMPFDVVADPARVVYDAFGVKQSRLMLMAPRTWRAMLRSARAATLPIPMRPDGGPFGLPADFLIAPSGQVLATKYGEHPDDQWSFDQVLELSRQAR